MRVIRNSSAPFLELKVGAQDEFSVRTHSHDELSLGLIEAGGAEVRVRESGFSLRERDLILIPPGTVHLCVPVDLAKYRFSMLYIDPLWFESVYSTDPMLLVPSVFTPTPPDDGGLPELFEVLSSDSAEGFEDAFILTLGRLVFECFRAAVPPVRPPAWDAVGKVREFLEGHFSEEVSLDMLSSLCGINKYHLLRQFGQSVGLTPHAYVVNLRINHAKALLKRGLPVSEVAAECGFFDQSHFVKTFRLYTGLIPGRYRS